MIINEQIAFDFLYSTNGDSAFVYLEIDGKFQFLENHKTFQGLQKGSKIQFIGLGDAIISLFSLFNINNIHCDFALKHSIAKLFCQSIGNRKGNMFITAIFQLSSL